MFEIPLPTAAPGRYRFALVLTDDTNSRPSFHEKALRGLANFLTERNVIDYVTSSRMQGRTVISSEAFHVLPDTPPTLTRR